MSPSPSRLPEPSQRIEWRFHTPGTGFEATPRDGWSSLVAFTIGWNGTVFPDGGFALANDLGEPYLDINDTSQHDRPGSPALAGTGYDEIKAGTSLLQTG